MTFDVTFAEEAPALHVKFGWSSGEFEAGRTAGAQEEYDRFWDGYQDYGNRVLYGSAFQYCDMQYLKPKYDIFSIATNMDSMFRETKNVGLLGLAEGLAMPNANSAVRTIWACHDLEEVGDVYAPKVTNITSFFYGCDALIKVGDINIPQDLSINHMFFGCSKLETIGRIKGLAGASTFQLCAALREFTLVTEQTETFSLRYSPLLTKAAMGNVIDVLSDTAAGKTVTFSRAAKEAAFTDEEWAQLIGTKPNWTISLV